MEWAAGGKVLARLSQLHTAIDHLDDIDAIEQVIDKSLGNFRHGVSSLQLVVQFTAKDVRCPRRSNVVSSFGLR